MVRTGLIATVALAVASLSSLQALSLEPMSVVFGTSPDERVRTFQVANTQSQRISVRIRMTSRDQTVTGEELREDAREDWIVFPRQVTLEPGATQAVRVQYVGPVGIEVEQSYRIVAEQLPVDFSRGAQPASGINILFRYEGSVYVRPAGARPDVVLADVSRDRGPEGSPVARIRFENRGRAHAILENLLIRIDRIDEQGLSLGTLELGVEDLSVLAGANLLAGRALEEIVQLPDDWESGTLDVEYHADILR